MTNSLNSRAAANLRAEIVRKGLTQEQFAEKANFTRATLGNILAGRTAIDLPRLELFADLLEIEPAKLIND